MILSLNAKLRQVRTEFLRLLSGKAASRTHEFLLRTGMNPRCGSTRRAARPPGGGARCAAQPEATTHATARMRLLGGSKLLPCAAAGPREPETQPPSGGAGRGALHCCGTTAAGRWLPAHSLDQGAQRQGKGPRLRLRGWRGSKAVTPSPQQPQPQHLTHNKGEGGKS